MSSINEYTVNINEQDIIVQVTQTEYEQVTAVGEIPLQVVIMGGVPGPPGESDSNLIALHILDPTPHPPYDDMPSMTLLFENGLI